MIAYYNDKHIGERCGRMNDGATVFQSEVWGINTAARFITTNWALINLPLPKSFITAQIDKQVYEKWENRWVNYSHARMTKQSYPKLIPNNAKHVLRLGRFNLTKYINLVTGHNELAYHASVCDNTLCSNCTFCNTSEETFFHLVTDCPSLRLTRESIFLDKPPDTGFPWKVKDLLKFSCVPKIEKLIEWGVTTSID